MAEEKRLNDFVKSELSSFLEDSIKENAEYIAMVTEVITSLRKDPTYKNAIEGMEKIGEYTQKKIDTMNKYQGILEHCLN